MTDRPLSAAALREEFSTVRRLVSAGLADVYLLLTNYRLSGQTDAEIRAALIEAGVKTPFIYGSEWISARIYESNRLRALVPRLYGLGDLSQILDERVYEQAEALLVTLKESLKTFVPTGAYRRALDALSSHRLVLLLGEPASGKTSIASTLSLHATDAWQARLIRLIRPRDFQTHWNPHEPRQLFWMDDAFGTTQYQEDLVREWNQLFPLLGTALQRGTRCILTSRDYIYRRAKPELKTGILPALLDSQIIVRTAELTTEEKERILYSHVRLGDQFPEFRGAIKGFLRDAAAHPRFLPETARRLGARLFTADLSPTQEGVLQFIGNPETFLLQTIRELGEDDRAALAAIHANGGVLPSPIAPAAVSLVTSELGSSLPRIRAALESLEGSFVTLVADTERRYWSFTHPTIGDAFGTFLSASPELLIVYLRTAPLERLLREVTAGDVGLKGVKIVLTPADYRLMIDRVLPALKNPDYNRYAYSFLSSRADRNFLQQFLATAPGLLDGLVPTSSYLSAYAEMGLLARLRSVSLLPEAIRQRFIGVVRELSIETPDADFLTVRQVGQLLSPVELDDIMRHVEESLDTEEAIRNFRSNYSRFEGSPESYFAPLKEALEAYQRYFREKGRADTAATMRKALFRIDHVILNLQEEEDADMEPWDPEPEDYQPTPSAASPSDRDPFDDVDS